MVSHMYCACKHLFFTQEFLLQREVQMYQRSAFRSLACALRSLRSLAVFDITEVDGSKVENPRKLEALTQVRYAGRASPAKLNSYSVINIMLLTILRFADVER